MTDTFAPEVNPPPFSPYFTLTTSWFFNDKRRELGNPPVTVPPIPRQPKSKPERLTVKGFYGRMSTMSDDTQAQFLLLLMKHADVDWSAACKEAAKARCIRPLSQVQGRLSQIANKHDFRLEEGKKITGGLLLNKTLLTKPAGDPAGSKEPKLPKIPRKRKSGNVDPKALGIKKKRTTSETQTTEKEKLVETVDIPIPVYAPARETDDGRGAGSDDTRA